MNTKTKEGARDKGNPYFLRVPWNKGGLVNTDPDASRSFVHLVRGAWNRTDEAFGPSTSSAYLTHFKTFIAFLLFLNFPIVISVHNILIS